MESVDACWSNVSAFLRITNIYWYVTGIIMTLILYVNKDFISHNYIKLMEYLKDMERNPEIVSPIIQNHSKRRDQIYSNL